MKKDILLARDSKSLKEARTIAEFISTKKAEDIVILDIRKISNLCDYYVICSGSSSTQIKAIHDYALRKSKEKKIKVQHSETDLTYQWVLIDYIDVMLHIFSKEARKFYNLEYLWKKAKRVDPFKK